MKTDRAKEVKNMTSKKALAPWEPQLVIRPHAEVVAEMRALLKAARKEAGL